MKSKAILIGKVVFLALIIASFFILEDPIVRKCRKAELVIANMQVAQSDANTVQMCNNKLNKAKTLIEIAQILDCQLETKKKMGTKEDSESIVELNTRIESLRSEAELLLDEIIIATISPEQLALIK